MSSEDISDDPNTIGLTTITTKNGTVKDRMVDATGYRRRAACICIRNNNPCEVLLVTSRTVLDKWIIPGGGVEPNEKETDAASREVFEEAGVRGHIVCRIDNFTEEKSKSKTTLFLFNVKTELKQWPEKGRGRTWFPIQYAIETIKKTKPSQLEYLTKFSELVETSKKCQD